MLAIPIPRASALNAHRADERVALSKAQAVFQRGAHRLQRVKALRGEPVEKPRGPGRPQALRVPTSYMTPVHNI